MTLSRWKLLAGVFGISLVGVVAMANPQCPGAGKTDPAREKAPQSREVAVKPADVPKQAVVPIPQIVSELPPATAVPLPEPATPPGLPVLGPNPEIPPANSKIETAPLPVVSPIPLPVAKPDPVIELPLPGVAVSPQTIPVIDLHSSLPPVEPARRPAAPPPSTLVPIDRLERSREISSTVPTLTASPEPTRAVPVIRDEVETRVRVVVPLNKGQAKFEVLTGDTVLLQAVCEQVEVRSPGDKATPASPIKASGKVRFAAPGCDGTCDTLCVLPSSGEVELTGSILVKCKHGQAETVIQATSMKFKLGSIPGAIAGSESGSQR